MEPPRHDVWDPDYPDKGANKKIESEYVVFIRICIKDLAPIDDISVIAVPGLNRYLPDDDDDINEKNFDSSDESSKNETYDRNFLPEKIIGQPAERKKQKMQSDSTHPTVYGESLTDQGEGEVFVVREGKTQNDSDGGNKTGSGDKYSKDADTTSGRSGGVNSKPAIRIDYRTFVINQKSGVYRVSVKPETNIQSQAELKFWIVGDDQKIEAEIQSARLVAGEDISVSRNCVIGPLWLPLDGIQVEIILKTPRKVAMEVTAHEIV